MLVAIPCKVHKIVRSVIESRKDSEGKPTDTVQRAWNAITYQLLVDLPGKPSELNNVVIMENVGNAMPQPDSMLESAQRSGAEVVIWAEVNPDRRPERRGELNVKILEVVPGFDSKPLSGRPGNGPSADKESGKA